MVVKDSECQMGVFPGQPIRFPLEGKGRFVPAAVEQWLRAFTIDQSGGGLGAPQVH